MSVAEREGIDVSENTLSVVARAAAGSFRDAIGTLDQLAAYCEGTVALQDALAILGVAELDLLFEIVDVVVGRDTQAALLFVEAQSQAGTDLNQFMKDLLGHLRDLYVVQHTAEPPESVAASREHLDHIVSQANRVPTPELVAFIDLLGEAQRSVRQGADPRL
jgi:DNA polymerase-3 subunit gamma/tau